MKNIHYALYREEADYVAQCLDVDVASFGSTAEEAVRNLKEAVELYFEDTEDAHSIPVISEVTVGELAIA